MEQRRISGYPYGQNGPEERIAKLLNEANKVMHVHGVPSLGPQKDVCSPIPAVSLALPISQVLMKKGCSLRIVNIVWGDEKININ